jgi:putative transport protein
MTSAAIDSRTRAGGRVAWLTTGFVAWAGPALAGEVGPGFRWDLGPIGGTLHFLGVQPFVLMFLTLALGTVIGRRKLGFISLGSTAGTLLAGIGISIAAFLGYGLKYEVPSLLTTIFLNLFMFAVGLKVGPQFFSGLRLDGAKFVVISLVVVLLNFAIAFGLAKALNLSPGLATGLISGSMTDTAVIGAATGAVESGSYQPPEGVSAKDVIGNVAAGYAITYLFSLVGIILLIRYLPRLSGVDARAAAREAEQTYGGGTSQVPTVGADVAAALPALAVDVRAYRVENEKLFGMSVHELSDRADAPVLRLARDGKVVDLASDPRVQRGDVITVLTGVERLVTLAEAKVGPEVPDAEARRVDLEVADLVLTNRALAGLTLQETVDRLRSSIFPNAERVGRLVQVVAYLRAGEPYPVYPTTRVQRGDIVRVIGPRERIDMMGKFVGAVVRATSVSDVLTIALGLALGYIIGYLNVSIAGIPISLGTPAGVMLAGILISTLRSRYPLFGGPVSEGARSLLQDLGLDLFIAVVALNTAPNVVAAFAGGGVLKILAVGVTASIVPPLVAWFVGLKLLKLNPAVLMGALCGARFCTPALRAAQEETGSAIPGVGYPVPYAITAVLVLVAGYLALFL